MRRSEMLNVIHNMLLEVSDGYVKGGVIGFEVNETTDNLRGAAEHVLNEILAEGMAPPLRRLTEREDPDAQVEDVYVHAWEEE